jgi:anti-anti-sigma regulatory factor
MVYASPRCSSADQSLAGARGQPMTAHEVAIVHQSPSLSHLDACQIFDLALNQHSDADTVVIDLKSVQDATTSAFAQLVLLRRSLLKAGRDLKLVGLRDRAAFLFGINRLNTVLPVA